MAMRIIMPKQYRNAKIYEAVRTQVWACFVVVVVLLLCDFSSDYRPNKSQLYV